MRLFIPFPVFFFLIISLLPACKNNAPTLLTQKWAKTTLTFESQLTSEISEDNPFLNYRLNVLFSHPEKTVIIPGFYAADGNAGETNKC